MSTIEIPNPQLPEWLKILNTYDPTHYVPGKKVTAEEWNTLFLASVNQGNYLAETVDLLVKEYLPNTFVEQVSFEKYISDTNNTFQDIHNTASSLQTQITKANSTSEEALLLSRVAKANSEEAISTSIEAKNNSEEATTVAKKAELSSLEAVKISEEAHTLAASANLNSESAQENSTKAYTAATEAKTTAETIDGKASHALDLAMTAKTSSEIAQSQATLALELSDRAFYDSATALANSREAMQDASSAQSDAATALAQAQEALAKIDQAITQGGTIVSTDDGTAQASLYLTKNLEDTRENSTLVTSTVQNALKTKVDLSSAQTISGKKTFTSAVEVNAGINITGDLNVSGDIIQQGTAYETHAEQVYSTKDYIYLREGNTGSLANGAYTGFEFKKYDGINNGRLVVDNKGIARVGDVGDEQPLATREEAPLDKHLIVWNEKASRLDTSSEFTANHLIGLKEQDLRAGKNKLDISNLIGTNEDGSDEDDIPSSATVDVATGTVEYYPGQYVYPPIPAEFPVTTTVKLKPNTQYTLSGIAPSDLSSSAGYISLGISSLLDARFEKGGSFYYTFTTKTNEDYTFSLCAGDAVTISKLQIEEGPSVTVFEAYSGDAPEEDKVVYQSDINAILGDLNTILDDILGV